MIYRLASERRMAWHELGEWASRLGDVNRALDYLERALEENGFLLFISAHPSFDPLRDQPRFRRLLAELELPGS